MLPTLTPPLPADMFDPRTLSQGLGDGRAIASCKSAIATATDHLHARFRAGAPVETLLRQRAAFIDEVLGALWDQQSWSSEELALVAVGGYGRMTRPVARGSVCRPKTVPRRTG